MSSRVLQLPLFDRNPALYPRMHWKTQAHWLVLWNAVAALETRGRLEGAFGPAGPRILRRMGVDHRSVAAMEAAGAVSREGTTLVLVGYDTHREDAREARQRWLSERGRRNAELRWARERARWRAVTSDPMSDPMSRCTPAKSHETGMLASNAMRARAPEIPDQRSLPSVPDPLLAGLRPASDPAPIAGAEPLAGWPAGARKTWAAYPAHKLRARHAPLFLQRWRELELEPHAERVLELLRRTAIGRDWQAGVIPWAPNWLRDAAAALVRKPAPSSAPPRPAAETRPVVPAAPPPGGWKAHRDPPERRP